MGHTGLVRKLPGEELFWGVAGVEDPSLPQWQLAFSGETLPYSTYSLWGVWPEIHVTYPTPFPSLPFLPPPKGVATDAKVGSELIKVMALDSDVGNNSLVLYNILGIHYIKQHSNDSEEVASVFSIGKYPCVTTRASSRDVSLDSTEIQRFSFPSFPPTGRDRN